jgi:membrane-bound serine protease (ClpP class)
MTMMKWFTALAVALLWALPARAAEVHVLAVSGPIGPAFADYVVRGIERAARHGARLVVIEMDTPGGLDTSMRSIIKAILASPVPVATYVSPQGARAASAGTYILYASHVAAMAPATNLGAATPVDLAPAAEGGTARKEAPVDAKTRKAVHDAAAYIRGLAELRGRNAQWAERAVREAVSLPASEAARLGVVDFVATDLSDLLRQSHGRKVRVAAGTVTLDTAGLAVVRVEPDWRSRLLAVIGDPGIAYILLIIGIYGLLYEFANPGMVLPGIVGGIALLLALFALQLMPVSYVGLALILLGVALMAAEAFAPSFGALGLGGITAFVIGSVMLIDVDAPGLGISWKLIAPLAVAAAAFSFVVARLALAARRRPVVTGSEALIGATGTVVKPGWARIHSELWQIHSRNRLPPGTVVRVTARHDLALDVEPVQPDSKENPHV